MRKLEPVLVTGASGFLGAAVLRRMRDAGVRDVVATSRRRPASWAGRWIAADLLVRAEIEKVVDAAQPRTILHLAGTPRETHVSRQARDSDRPPTAAEPGNPADAAHDDRYPICDRGARNLVAALSDLSGSGGGDAPRVILAGSSAVYGVLKNEGPVFDETCAPKPGGEYGRAKLEEERIFQSACDKNVVVARLFNLVGPGQPPGLVARDLLDELRARCNEPGWWRETPGRFAHGRDLVDVRDAARAVLLLARAPQPPAVINVCTGRAVAAWTVLGELRRVLEIDNGGDQREDGIPPTLLSWQAGAPALLERLGWKPEIPLARSLADMAAGSTI